jgi:hypothetical protein
LESVENTSFKSSTCRTNRGFKPLFSQYFEIFAVCFAVFSFPIFLLQIVAWFSFDWNQLIPGIGLLPGITALAVVLVTIVYLILFHRIKGGKEPQRKITRFKTPMVAAWIVCLGAITSILLWLQNGIYFF